MIIAVAAFLFVTFLFGCLGVCIAKGVKGRQKVWALLFTFAGWAAIVAYATNLAGLWGTTIDTSAPIPHWFMIPFCVIFSTLPITIPLCVAIGEIWRAGGRDTDFTRALWFFGQEEGVSVLYIVSLGMSFYLTERFGIHYGWSFPISLPLLLFTYGAVAGFVGGICWLATRLARRFSPVGKRAKK